MSSLHNAAKTLCDQSWDSITNVNPFEANPTRNTVIQELIFYIEKLIADNEILRAKLQWRNMTAKLTEENYDIHRSTENRRNNRLH